jgi:hypothetical protein
MARYRFPTGFGEEDTSLEEGRGDRSRKEGERERKERDGKRRDAL